MIKLKQKTTLLGLAGIASSIIGLLSGALDMSTFATSMANSIGLVVVDA